MSMSIVKIFLILTITMSMVGCIRTAGLDGKKTNQLVIIPEKIWHKKADASYHGRLEHLAKNGMLIKDQKLNNVMHQLLPIAYAYRPASEKWNWKIKAALSNKLTAHGFAGGKILINTGMYWGLHLTEDELAYVIAHEMAHALLEHNRERISTDLILGPLARLKNVEGVSTVWKIEQEADLMALLMLNKAGYSPEAVLTFWDKYIDETERRARHTGKAQLMSAAFMNYRKTALEKGVQAL